MSNTARTCDGVEIYTDRIFELADDFFDHELTERQREDIYNKSSIFRAMILFIADNIPKPDNNDIELLDDIFNIYIYVYVVSMTNYLR